MTRLALLAVLFSRVVAAGGAAATSTPGRPSTATQRAGSTMGNVSVKLDVTKFVKSGRRLIAQGTAIATYTPESGTPTVVRQPFTARVAVAGKRSLSGVQAQKTICQVLTLQL